MNPREEPPEKLTLHQAADALNASTAHVKELLGQGLIAHHGEGARLRIDRGTLLAYRRAKPRNKGAGTEPEPSSLPARASRLLLSSLVLGLLLSRHSP